MDAMAQQSWEKGAPLREVNLPDAPLRADEVRVRVRFAGVNPVDWKMRSLGPLRAAARLLGPPPPVVVGVDFAGAVEGVGTDVQGIAIGAHVVGGTDFSRKQRGSYASHVVVRADQVCPLPKNIPLDIAGALPVAGVTAWLSIVELGELPRHQRSTPCPRVLVLGASGGVGHLAIQIARLHGGDVVGVCSSANHDFIQELGCQHVIDYRDQDALVAAERFGPFHVVVDCVGSYSGAGCRRLLAPGGRHILVSGSRVNDIVDAMLHPRQTRMVLGTPNAERLSPLVEALSQGKFRLHIEDRIPLRAAESAHERIRAGGVRGKLVLDVGGRCSDAEAPR